MPKLMKTTMLIGLLGLSVSAASGCVDQEASMKLQGNFVRTVPVEEGKEANLAECGFPESATDENATVTSSGFIDLMQISSTGQPGNNVANVFNFGASISSQLINNANANDVNLRVNTNSILVTGAEIIYNFNSSSVTFERSFSAIVEPQGATLLFIDVPLLASADDVAQVRDCVNRELAEFQLPADRAKLLQVPVFVDIKIKGETLDGESVESHVFTYPVDVCLGCGRASTPACISVEE